MDPGEYERKMVSERRWRREEVSGVTYSPRTGHAVVDYEGDLYLFGGMDKRRRQQDLFKFSVSTKKWEEVEVSGSVPSRRSGAVAVVNGNKMYIFGGYEGREGSYYNDLYSFDFKTREWELVRPKALREASDEEPTAFYGRPNPRTDHSMVSYERSLIVFGGFDGVSRYNDVHAFDLDSYTWRELTLKQNASKKPTGRFGHSGVVFEDHLWIFGGWDGRVTLNSLWALNLKTERWISLRSLRAKQHLETPFNGMRLGDSIPMNSSSEISIQAGNVPVPARHQGDHSSFRSWVRTRAFHGAPIGKRRLSTMYAEIENASTVANNGHDSENEDKRPAQARRTSIVHHERSDSLFSTNSNGSDAVSYYSDRSDCSDSVKSWEDSSDSRTWDEGFTPKNRYRHCAIVHGNTMVVFGGVDKDHFRFNDLLKFDFDTLSWSIFETAGIPPSSRTFHRAVNVGDMLYVLGGYDGVDRLNDMYSVYLGNLSPPSLVDLTASFMRQNISTMLKYGQFHYVAPFVLQSVVFARDSAGKLRGGRWEGHIHVCHRFVERTTPFLKPLVAGSNPADDSSDTESVETPSEERCAECGGSVWQHVLIDEEKLYCDDPECWEPDLELSSTSAVAHLREEEYYDDEDEADQGISTKDFGCLQFACFADERTVSGHVSSTAACSTSSSGGYHHQTTSRSESKRNGKIRKRWRKTFRMRTNGGSQHDNVEISQ